jgi:4-coumarate--CoA ligase
VSFFPGPHANVPGSSAGALASNIKVKVVDPATGRKLGFGEVGELWSHSPSNAIGYLGDDKSTRETFDDEGYVHSECRPWRTCEAEVRADGFYVG